MLKFMKLYTVRYEFNLEALNTLISTVANMTLSKEKPLEPTRPHVGNKAWDCYADEIEACLHHSESSLDMAILLARKFCKENIGE